MSSIMLTTEEIWELKRMCNDPFLELGMTLRPKHLKCFKSHIVNHSIRSTIFFENHEDAVKWNKLHEDRIRKSGHLATIALAALVCSIGGSYGAMFITTSAVAIIKDEIQAKIWYPEMFEGWKLTRYFDFIYEQYPRQHLYMSWNDLIQNKDGKEIENKKHGQCHIDVGGSFGMTEQLVRKIMNSYPINTTKFK